MQTRRQTELSSQHLCMYVVQSLTAVWWLVLVHGWHCRGVTERPMVSLPNQVGPSPCDRSSKLS